MVLSAENVTKYWSGTCKRKMESNLENTLHQKRILRAKEQQQEEHRPLLAKLQDN